MAHEIALSLPSNEAANRMTKLLHTAGFRVIQSFDLRVARSLLHDCACPHHGTTSCNCEYIVLLVYRGNNPPLTLVIHGYDDFSWCLIADSSSQPLDPQFPEVVIQILSPERRVLAFEAN